MYCGRLPFLDRNTLAFLIIRGITMNKIQFIGTTHSCKDNALKDKRMCNSLHNVYYTEADFHTVGDLLEAGSTFGRIGNKTDFIAIDIDNTTVNISKVVETFKNDDNYRISYSSSNNPLKYHILVNLNKEIDISEYNDNVEREFKKIKDLVCTRFDIFELDKNASNFYQCFYGQSVDSDINFNIDNSKRLYCWCKKGSQPKFYIESGLKLRPSLNSADYCNKHNLLTVEEPKRFDIILPSMTNGRMKQIAEGHRFQWCRMTGTKLLMRIFHLNHVFNEGWTKWDFLECAEWAFRDNVVNVKNFESDINTLLLWLDNKWDILANKTYEEQCEILEPYFNCSKRQYKARNYNATIMSQMILEHQIDDNTILFTDKEELQNLCKENLVDYYKFINFAKSVRFNVEFECITGLRKKYDCSGMTIDEFNDYCKDNKINKVTKSRLKKKYFNN